MAEAVLTTALELDGGRLPERWRVVTLPEISKRMKAGGTPSRGVAAYWNGDIPFVKIEDITSAAASEILKTTAFITKSGLDNSSAWVVEPGAVLVAMYASIGATAINRIPAATNQAILAIQPDESVVDTWFLHYALRHATPRLASHNIQTTQKNVSKAIMERFPIPLPPLGEQEAIASVLRRVQQARAATDKVITATRELKRSLMRHLFTYGLVPIERTEDVPLKETEIGPIPARWSVQAIGELADSVQYGTSERCEEKPTEFPVLGIRNVVSGRINTEGVKYLPPNGKTKPDRLLLAPGDLLFVRTNATRANVGRCAIYNGDPEPALFASYLLRARLKPEVVLPEFLYRFAWSEAGVRFLSGRASGAADGKFNINTQILRSVPVPVPSMSEQQAIVEMLAAIDARLDAERRRRNALEETFNSLLRELMIGRRLVGLAGAS